MLEFAVAEGHVQIYKESDYTSDIIAHGSASGRVTRWN